MRPEIFATHSNPVDRIALYTVYRPNMGYRDDQHFEPCEEMDNVLYAINQIQEQFKELKEKYQIQLAKLDLQNLPDNEILEKKQALKQAYKIVKAQLFKRNTELEKQKKEIEERYGILGKQGGKLTFHSVLIHELFRFLTKEQSDTAIRNAKEYCAKLGI